MELNYCIRNLISDIRKYIYTNDIKLDEIKNLFNENFEKFKQDFLNEINYIQSQVHIDGYSFDNLIKTDDIIDIMLSYNVIPRNGIFTWGYHTTHLKSLELAFTHNVIPFINYRHYLNNAMTLIRMSKRPVCQIISAIDLFIKHGYNFNDYYVIFLITWNLPILKYIISNITRPVDYMGELISGLKMIPRIYVFDDVKNVIDYILEIVISQGVLNRQDDVGCTDLHYICDDYISLQLTSLYCAPYYQYLIECMLLNGADINIQNNNKLTPLELDPNVYRMIENKQLETKLHNKLKTFVREIFLNRDEAIVFVKEVSWYLDPNIADVVFGHRYKFDTSIHYDLAKTVYE